MEELLKKLDAEFKITNAETKIDEMFENLEESAFYEPKKFTAHECIPPVISGITSEWWKILAATPDMGNQLQNILNKFAAIQIKPIHRDILNFARYCNPDKIKVLIIGQDPYDTESHAHGLAFSSQQSNTPKSLANIFKALAKSNLLCDGKQKPLTNNLSSWAAQGVILLNTALTVLPDQPKSHLAEWSSYIKQLCQSIGQDRQLVVMLWGEKAEKYETLFIGHKILKYHHPSPLAGDFSYCPNFLECNQFLTSAGKTPIIWDPDYPTWCEVYTDGSSYPNTTGPDVASGYSAIFTAGVYKTLKIYGRTENKEPYFSNNIRAEGTAIMKALERAVLLDPFHRQTLHIVSDCEFWIKMITTWIPSCIEKSDIATILEYEKNPHDYKNPDIIAAIWQLKINLESSGTFIVFSHVYSHDKKKGSKAPKFSTEYNRYIYNKLADDLAKHVRVNLKNDQYGEMTTMMESDGFRF